MVKIFKLVLRQVFHLAFLGCHKLFQELTAFGMRFSLVKSNHVCKVRFFAFVTAKDRRKNFNNAVGQIALALQDLIEHR